MKPVIIVHGGAGNWPRVRHHAALSGVDRAARLGFEILSKAGNALNAVEAAVVSLEDNPTFNAGTGSALNLLGEVEDDAAIMDGRSLESGAVAIVKGVRNPVRLARLVMDRTDHVLVGGLGANRLAKACKLPTAQLRTSRRVRSWRAEVRKLKEGRIRTFPRNYRLLNEGKLDNAGNTVGALALDSKGDLAAACSTGGMSLKLPGRIGDTAIVGAGLYADNSTGAATATGIGELAIRATISRVACDLMRDQAAGAAAERATRQVGKRLGKGLGLITLKRNGQYGVAHNTLNLCWAVQSDDSGTTARMSGRRV